MEAAMYFKMKQLRQNDLSGDSGAGERPTGLFKGALGVPGSNIYHPHGL